MKTEKKEAVKNDTVKSSKAAKEAEEVKKPEVAYVAMEEEKKAITPEKDGAAVEEASGKKPEQAKSEKALVEDGDAEMKGNDHAAEEEDDNDAKDSQKSEKEDGEVLEKSETMEEAEESEEIFIPQAEYSAVCNADFLPMICNEFI